MGLFACFRPNKACGVVDAGLIVASKPTASGCSTQNGKTMDAAAEPHTAREAPAAPAAEPGQAAALDPSCACLGLAMRPGAAYDVTASGPPLPGCEGDRLEQSHLGELLEFAPREELQNILALVCNMFRVKNALVSLFFDRRVYIIDGTGAFAEGDFPWRYSMCGWTMASERHCVMIVNDVTQDARFCNNPAARQLGVRFYVGAPLVSSSGHRLGTLCFADTEPRVFDDASLKLLCTLGELVTRALERDLLLAHHQQVMQPGQALRELQEKHRYSMALRSVDTISSPVLLIDTGTTGWVVRYANSGWRQLVQQQMQSQATQDWVNAAANAPPAGQHTPSAASASTAPSDAAAAAASGSVAASTGGSGQQLPSVLQNPNPGDFRRIAGHLLFPIIERQLAKEPDRGSSILKQLQQLLSTQQPFSLHGLELEAFGGAPATLVFRSAGLSDLDDSVSICVPTWVPQPGAVPTAAAALQSTAADHAAPNTACPAWQTLYFVTVLLEGPEARGVQVKLPGTQASSCGTFSVGAGRGGSSVSGSSSSSSRMSLSLPSAGQLPEGSARCVYDDSNLLLLSRMSSDCGSVHTTAVSSSSNAQTTSASGSHLQRSGSTQAASLVGSCVTSITGVTAAAAARAVCSKIEGLRMGGLIASGSYGRVYRGDYYGSTVAVKVLESDSVIRREAVTGLCLEALLGEKFRHPNIIATLAWAVVTGKDKLAVGKRLWGETLDASKPSIGQNKAAIAASGAASDQQRQHDQQQQRSLAAAAGSAHSNGSAKHGSLDLPPCASQRLPSLDYVREDEAFVDSSDSNSNCVAAAETWLVLQYCNKGCLQDAIDRGWLLERPGGPVSLAKVIVTATEVAAGMSMLHKADVIHGDLSPYNVLLSGQDPAASEAGRGFVAKISDFGLSRPLGGQSKMLTKTYGTITHMPPETLEHGVTSKAADVFSFGVLLWQMLATSRAWAGLSHHAVVHAVCVKKQQLQFPPDAPEPLVELGQACMSHSPEERPAFRDVLEVLMPLRDYICKALGQQQQQ